jgi:hypothetical protein
MLPIIWLATVAGLAKFPPPGFRAVGVALLVAGTVGCYIADSSLPGGGDFEPEDIVWTDRSEQIALLVAAVPDGRSLAASRRPLGHVAERFDLWVFPPNYAGNLWPPEERIENQLFDLTNDQTFAALESRSSPLRARRPYTIWIAGRDAMMLTDRPPPPAYQDGRDLGPIRLLGYNLLRTSDAGELTLHWRATERPGVPLTRIVRLLDRDGRPLAEYTGLVLDDLLPTDEWQAGQTVLDRVPFGIEGAAATRAAVGWRRPDGSTDLVEFELEGQ